MNAASEELEKAVAYAHLSERVCAVIVAAGVIYLATVFLPQVASLALVTPQ